MRPIFSNSIIALLSALLLMTTSVAVAQPPPERHMGRDRERIQSVIIGKYATEMELTPEQAEKFFPRLRQFQERMEVIQRDECEARRELDKFSQTPNGDPAQLNSLLERRKSADQQIAGMKQEFLSDISSFLTPQQVSRCSILLDDLPRKVREMIREKKRSESGGVQPMRKGGSHSRRR